MPLPTGDDRQTRLDCAARAEGCAWATWWRAELGRQSRPMEGSWPGTLSEARARMARRIGLELGPGFAVTAKELEEAARIAYGAARREWNQNCERDVETK